MENNESPEVLMEEVVQQNGGGDPEMNSIQLLLGSEIDNPVLNDQQVTLVINNNWIREVRIHAHQYIERTGNQLGLSVRTVYMSVVYLDRFLASRRAINVGVYWQVRLLTVSCLSLSSQTEVNRANVPLLSEYPLGNWNLNMNDIRRMELFVLNVINWNMNFVTPFPFAHFFLSRFNRQISGSTRRRTTKIIMSVFRDVRLMNHHRPSVIAVAATLFAVNNNLTRQELEVEINALPLNGFLNIDNVWYCYNRLRELNN